jgi:hypothetical protein
MILKEKLAYKADESKTKLKYLLILAPETQVRYT